MCGINGIALAGEARGPVDAERLRQMRDTMRHRGPDGEGLFLDGNVGLGHRRLSIVDLASGQQPMANEQGSLVVVFNGEIYNHGEQRAALEARGHVYRTHSDTETILHLYEQHGREVVHHLRGMFAFAIWDRRKRELFLARDHLGVKPLYYVHDASGSLFFASEIKALIEAGAVAPALNYDALPDYLANHSTSGEATLFAGVQRLPPGCTLLWKDGKVSIERYWDISYRPDRADRGKSDEQLADEWGALFAQSVKSQLMADVPLGMFLSGGIDSASIAATVRTLTSAPFKTFSVAFAEREANELDFARLVADTLQTDHHEVVIGPEDFFAKLPDLVWHEDEPIAHPSSVALYFVAQLAARHVKVVLTGEGSDELLCGYERYRKTLYNRAASSIYHRWTTRGFRSLVRSAVARLPLSSRLQQRIRRTFLFLSPDLEDIYFDNFAVFPREMQRSLLTSDAKDRIGHLDPYRVAQECLDRTDAPGLIDRLLYADTHTYLQELLMKQDQMSMAASLESRVPFLDHLLVEFSSRLPERMKLRGLKTKYVLRKAMKGRLPEAILSRPKMGFPVPIGQWLRGPFRYLVDDYILGERARARGIFDHAFIERLVELHQSGAEDHSERLWALLNFEIWHRQFLDGDSNLSTLRSAA